MSGSTEYGGVAGATAIREDLDSAIGLVTRATRAVEDASEAARWQLATISREQSLVAEAVRPAADRAYATVRALCDEYWGLPRVERRVDGIARDLRRAAEEYAAAERNTMLAMSWSVVADALPGLASAGWWSARSLAAVMMQAGAPWNVAVRDWVAPEGQLQTVDVLNATTVHATTSVMCAVDLPGWMGSMSLYRAVVNALALNTWTLGRLLGRPSVLAWVPLEEAHQAPVPTDLGSLVAGIQSVAHHPDGAVGVQVVTDADGVESAVVSIPGTVDFWPGARTRLGSYENAATMARQMTEVMVHVVAALQHANVGRGTPVLLQGYSQGGMVAMALAQSEWFSDLYNVTHVMTVGSPAGHFEHADHVTYLHAINSGDVVPALGCDLPPDRTNVTTHVFDLRSPELALPVVADPSTLVGAHDLGNYAAYLSHVDQHAGASTQAWLDSAGAFIGDGRTAVTTVVEPAFEPKEVASLD